VTGVGSSGRFVRSIVISQAHTAVAEGGGKWFDFADG